MDKYYDFSDCKPSLKEFGGSDKKESVFFDGKRYMLKYNDEIPADKRNENTSSSRNNVFSEYVSCHIVSSLDIPVQNTLIGHRNGHIVVACEDFCVNGYDLNEFEKNGSTAGYKFKETRYPEIKDILSFVRKDNRIEPELVEKRFWDTFVIDSLLGNFDRHTGNWGYLFNDDIPDIKLAPIYDCGACLYPMISDRAMDKIVSSRNEVDKRIYQYPCAAFVNNGRKISYYDFMTSSETLSDYPLLIKSIKEITPKVSLDVISKIISNTPEMTEAREHFYRVMIKARYEQILVPAYEKTISRTPISLDERIAQAKKICEKENAIRKEQSPLKSKNVDDILL